MTSGETGESSQEIFRMLMRASSHYISKQFIYTLIVSAIIVLASLAYGASRGNQVEIAVANQTLREVETIAHESTWFSIFINNVGLTLLTFLPLIGVVWMIYVQFNTGWHLGAIAKGYNINYLVATSIVLTGIVGLIEYSAHTIALGESLFLVHSTTQGEFQRRVTQHSWLSITIVVSLLFLGGITEAFLRARPMAVRTERAASYSAALSFSGSSLISVVFCFRVVKFRKMTFPSSNSLGPTRTA